MTMINCHWIDSLLLIIPIFWCRSNATPIDNGVVGTPEIRCEQHTIAINFTTRNPFAGRLFVKGYSDKPGCVKAGQNDKSPSLEVPFTECGLQRLRTPTGPVRGMTMASTVVISFHNTFLTKVDRAYKISCFYMEAEKTVTTGLEVSMLTTSVIGNQVAMPVCRYEILKGEINGPPIKYAVVGQPVYHKWTCESETKGMYCMRVHTCFVADGQGGQNFQVIDDKGCGVDKYLLQNPTYINDLMVGQEAHVFKWADKPVLLFNCQIELKLKEGQTCEKPTCAAGGPKTKRSMSDRRLNLTRPTGVDVDVIPQKIVVLDLEDSEDKVDPNGELNDLLTNPSQSVATGNSISSGVCLSHVGFALFIAVLVVLVGSITCVSVLLANRLRSSKRKFAANT